MTPNDDELFLNYMNAHDKKKRSSKDLEKEDLLFIQEMGNLGSIPKQNQNGASPIQVKKYNKPQAPLPIEESLLFRKWVQAVPIVSKKEPVVKKKASKTGSDIPTIDLHGFTREEARHELTRFLDSISHNTKKIRIIHGKGLSTGSKSVIKKDVLNFLKYQKQHKNAIKDYSFESPKNGGHGATVVWLY